MAKRSSNGFERTGNAAGRDDLFDDDFEMSNKEASSQVNVSEKEDKKDTKKK